MKVAISVVWMAFALLFFGLGRAHWVEAENSIPSFEITRPVYEISGSGFKVEIDVAGSPLDQPFESFAKDFNEYLEVKNQSASASNRRAAWGYFLASATAIASMLLGLRGAAAKNRNVVRSAAESGGPTA